MAPKAKNDGSSKKAMNKGAWTAEEDKKLSQYIEIHGAKRWETAAATAGLNRCGKSCRLRWLNYLRPNIKRGNISDAEEDLILRLHKLLGNRWSLIAGRLPGRTDNEIKNYWNSHLNKKINKVKKTSKVSTVSDDADHHDDEDYCTKITMPEKSGGSSININAEVVVVEMDAEETGRVKENIGNPKAANVVDVNGLFEGSRGLEWVNKFLELDEDAWLIEKP